MTIYFDLDGTVADLYNVPNWLKSLCEFDSSPYKRAKPLLNMSQLARLLHRAQRLGYRVGIVSWLSKNSTAEYDEAVKLAKIFWLKSHLPSIEWDEIKIVPYGIPKSSVIEDKNGFLFDDEIGNRNEWRGEAFTPEQIIEVLKELC